MDRRLEDDFDAVVMLTWSDWHTEPRSNRYHYATRFAKRLPVYFVQLKNGIDGIEIEKIDEHNIILVHIRDNYGRGQSELLAETLSLRGVRKPLIWAYNTYFEDFIHFYPARFCVYHATEDYFYTSDSWTVAGVAVQHQLRRILKETELLVSVSAGVATSYRDAGGYAGPSIVLRNGCDFEFWKATKAFEYAPPESGRKVAFFQGAINVRLDFELLRDVARAMPEWEFWFCGENVDLPGWREVASLPNVKDFGYLSPGEIAGLAKHSLVGLIPYLQGELIARSLPLKAYEYVACGLPVVTVPIVELAARPDMFAEARNTEEFCRAIEALAPTRSDPDLLEARLATANTESYDRRFEDLESAIAEGLRAREERHVRGNILLLYDHSAQNSKEALNELLKLQAASSHNVLFRKVATHNRAKSPRSSELACFDAIIVHTSSLPASRATIAEALRAYSGTKILMAGAGEDVAAIEIGDADALDFNAILTGTSQDTQRRAAAILPKIERLLLGGDGETAFASALDRFLDRRMAGRARARLVQFGIPVLVAYGLEGPAEPAWDAARPIGWSADYRLEQDGMPAAIFGVVDQLLARQAAAHDALEALAAHLTAAKAAASEAAVPLSATPPPAATGISGRLVATWLLRKLWRLLPFRFRAAFGHYVVAPRSNSATRIDVRD